MDNRIVVVAGPTASGKTRLGIELAQALGGEIGLLISNITLFAVLIYELVGPLLTKIALTKAGDINPEGKTSAREEHAKAMGMTEYLPEAQETKNDSEQKA